MGFESFLILYWILHFAWYCIIFFPHICSTLSSCFTMNKNGYLIWNELPRWLSGKELPSSAGAMGWNIPLSWEYPLEREMTTHFSILVWEIPWAEESGGLESMESQRARHNLTAKQQPYETCLLFSPYRYLYSNVLFFLTWLQVIYST